MEDGTKPCPYCAEPIRIEAKYCKHCSRKLSPANTALALGDSWSCRRCGALSVLLQPWPSTGS